MRYRLKYLWIVTFILILACSNNKTDEQLDSLFKIDFDDKETIYSKVFTNTQLIKLETRDECLISEISQLEVADSSFVILDKKIKSIYTFNLDGKFIKKIGKIGRGPGEYVRPVYLITNHDHSLIKIYDSGLSKIITYKYDGTFINEIHIDKYLISFGEYKSGYWGYCSNVPNRGIDKKKFLKFVIFDNSGRTVDKIYGNKIVDNLILSNSYITSILEDTVVFIEPYSRYIYKLYDDKISLHHMFDFNDDFIPKKFFNRLQKLGTTENIAQIKMLDYATENFFFCFVNYFENEKLIYAFTPFKKTSILIRKKEKEVAKFSQIFQEDSWETFFIPVIGMHNKSLYSAILPLQFNEYIEENPLSSQARIDSIKNILKDVKYTDNPIIVKYDIQQN